MDKVFTVLFWVYVYLAIILLVCDAMGINKLSDDEIPDKPGQQSARHPLV